MDLVYRAGGSTSFRRESRLAECCRDLHTVGRTVTLAPEWYPMAEPGVSRDESWRVCVSGGHEDGPASLPESQDYDKRNRRGRHDQG
jgi:hypothetical protein